jgi:hypothetical protein
VAVGRAARALLGVGLAWKLHGLILEQGIGVCRTPFAFLDVSRGQNGVFACFTRTLAFYRHVSVAPLAKSDLHHGAPAAATNAAIIIIIIVIIVII